MDVTNKSNHSTKPLTSYNGLVVVAVGFGFVVSVVSFLVAGCASVKRQAAPAAPDRPEPGKGLIIFYRESHFKAGGGFDIHDLAKYPTDPTNILIGRKIGDLLNGSYFVYNTSPGEHTFAGLTPAKTEVCYRRVDIESNRTHYIRAALVKSRTGGTESRLELTVVDSSEGSEAIKNLKRVALSR